MWLKDSHCAALLSHTMGSGGSVETAPVPPVIRKMQKLPASRKVPLEKAENRRLPERRSDLVVEAMPSMKKPQSSRKVGEAESKRLPEALSDTPDEATPKIQKPQASQEGRNADVRRLLERRSSPPVETLKLQTPQVGLEKDEAEMKRLEIKRMAEKRSNPWETIPKMQKPQTRNVETADSKRLPERWSVPPVKTMAMMQKPQKPQAVSQGEKADIKRLLEGGRGSSQVDRIQRMQKPQASSERETYEIRPLRERWSEMVTSPIDTMSDMPMPDMPMPPATFVRERAEIRQLRAERLREERNLNVKRSRSLSCSTFAPMP